MMYKGHTYTIAHGSAWLINESGKAYMQLPTENELKEYVDGIEATKRSINEDTGLIPKSPQKKQEYCIFRRLKGDKNVSENYMYLVKKNRKMANSTMFRYGKPADLDVVRLESDAANKEIRRLINLYGDNYVYEKLKI